MTHLFELKRFSSIPLLSSSIPLLPARISLSAARAIFYTPLLIVPKAVLSPRAVALCILGAAFEAEAVPTETHHLVASLGAGDVGTAARAASRRALHAKHPLGSNLLLARCGDAAGVAIGLCSAERCMCFAALALMIRLHVAEQAAAAPTRRAVEFRRPILLLVLPPARVCASCGRAAAHAARLFEEESRVLVESLGPEQRVELSLFEWLSTAVEWARERLAARRAVSKPALQALFAESVAAAAQ